jgi:copper transport protein
MRANVRIGFVPAAAAAAAAAMLLPALAFAHVHLAGSTPADGSVVTSAPANIVLIFSEPARLTALSIRKAGSPGVQKLGPLPKLPSAHVALAAPRLDPGTYTLQFRALDPEDNHVSTGSFSFSLAPAGAAAPIRVDEMRNIGKRPTPPTSK